MLTPTLGVLLIIASIFLWRQSKKIQGLMAKNCEHLEELKSDRLYDLIEWSIFIAEGTFPPCPENSPRKIPYTQQREKFLRELSHIRDEYNIKKWDKANIPITPSETLDFWDNIQETLRFHSSLVDYYQIITLEEKNEIGQAHSKAQNALHSARQAILKLQKL